VGLRRGRAPSSEQRDWLSRLDARQQPGSPRREVSSVHLPNARPHWVASGAKAADQAESAATSDADRSVSCGVVGDDAVGEAADRLA
jgi:hypothetical protein